MTGTDGIQNFPAQPQRMGGICYACGDEFTVETVNDQPPVSAFGMSASGHVDAVCSDDCRALMNVMMRGAKS